MSRPFALFVAGLIVLAALSRRAPGEDPKPTATTATAPAPTTAPADIDPRAADVLRAAGKYLGDAKSFSFSADVWEDLVTARARKFQAQRTVDVAIRRPDRLVAHSRSRRKSRDAYYDGKSLTIYDPATNLFGVIADAPRTIDQTIDFVEDRFGLSLPLSDLIVSDLYGEMTEGVRRGDYLGVQQVAGAACYHLGFVQDDIDWQIWIDAGERPLVRRLVITYKHEDQSPQFQATIDKWSIGDDLPDYAFEFRAPIGAVKIDVLPASSAPDDPDRGEGADVAGHEQPPAKDPTTQPTPGRKE